MPSGEGNAAGQGDLSVSEFIALIEQAAYRIGDFIGNSSSRRIQANHSGDEIRQHLASYNFETPIAPAAVMSDCIEMLERWNLDTTHPRHFGWFNPSPDLASVAAELLVAAYNPQLAVWSASPIGTEIELHLLRYLGRRLWLSEKEISGSFTCGGLEANLTAIVMALSRFHPDYTERGLASLNESPLCYVSAEFHRSIEKAVVVAGLGREAIRVVPTNSVGVMSADALREMVKADRASGSSPFVVIANAGSTSLGALDPLTAIGEFCVAERLWFHVDAAWGGAAVLSEHQRHLMAGAELADSITIDPHKWMSMPLGTGMIVTRWPDVMQAAFRIQADYAAPGPERDMYTSSIQWSRRFRGLALFVALAVDGRPEMARRLDHQTQLSELLRKRLLDHGWTIDNSSPFPVVVFHDEAMRARTGEIADIVNRCGRVWVSETTLLDKTPVIRACICSFRTQSSDIDVLVEELDQARKAVRNYGRGS